VFVGAVVAGVSLIPGWTPRTGRRCWAWRRASPEPPPRPWRRRRRRGNRSAPASPASG